MSTSLRTYPAEEIIFADLEEGLSSAVPHGTAGMRLIYLVPAKRITAVKAPLLADVFSVLPMNPMVLSR